jgi:hypothetical protein
MYVTTVSAGCLGEIKQASPRLWLHPDVISLEYAHLFDSASEEKAAHVSQAGKRHPRPSLLVEQQPELYHHVVLPQLQQIMRHVLSALSAQPGFRAEHTAVDKGTQATPPPAILYSLLGLDLAVEPVAVEPEPWPESGPAALPMQAAMGDDGVAAVACRRVQLLEINSYPAIGNGTMSNVPREIYTRLVTDMCQVLGLLEPSPSGVGSGASSNCCYDSSAFLEVV